MDLGQGDAQACRLAREVATDLVGVQVGLGEEVADAGQRQVPAVAGGAQELLQHRELDRRVGLLVHEVEPAVERGDVRRPGLGEHLVDRHVGVHPGRDLAEDLHQRVLAERDRGVGLLAREQRRVRLEVEVVARQAVEGELATVGAGRRCGERAQPQRHRLPVVERVVDEGVAERRVVPLADQRVRQALLRLRVEGQRELVELALLAPLGAVGHLGEVDRDPQPGRGVRELTDTAYAGQRPLATLPAEPAGLADPRRQVVRPALVTHCSTPEPVGSVSRSHRKP